MNVFIHSFGLLLPYLNVFFAAILFKQIADLYPKQDSFVARYPALIAVVLSVTAWLGYVESAKCGIYFLYLFVATAPLVIAQVWLNEFWQSVETANLPLRQRFNGSELLFLALGVGFLGFIYSDFLTAMLPPIKLP